MPVRIALATALLALVILVPASAAQADWGSIAVNPKTGKTGYSFDYDTIGGAKRRARNECGKGCVFAVAVRNGWAALVLKRNGVFVAGVGRTKAIAFREARHRAHEQSARKVTSVFSGY